MTEKTKLSCPECQSTNTKKAGKKVTRHEHKQQYQCNTCAVGGFFGGIMAFAGNHYFQKQETSNSDKETQKEKA